LDESGGLRTTYKNHQLHRLRLIFSSSFSSSLWEEHLVMVLLAVDNVAVAVVHPMLLAVLVVVFPNDFVAAVAVLPNLQVAGALFDVDPIDLHAVVVENAVVVDHL
jgi:ABC-type uncharacterized transport system permease subunit